MAKEGGNFFFAHLVRVAFFMKNDEAANPINVSLLGPDGVAFDSQVPADAVEKLWRLSGGRDRVGGKHEQRL